MAILGMLPDSAQRSPEGQYWMARDILKSSGKRNAQNSRNKNCLYPSGKWRRNESAAAEQATRSESRAMIHQKDADGTGDPRSEQRQLERFGLRREVLRQYPHTLSGGMKQRSLIVMGVMEQAPVLFADEPTKGLDPAADFADRRLLCKAEGTDACYASHTICVLRQAAAEKICVLYASQTVEYSEKEEFFKKPLHPYSQAILQALPENGLQVSEGFAPPREDADAQKGCHYRRRCRFCSEKCKEKPPMFEVGTRKVRCWLYAHRS